MEETKDVSVRSVSIKYGVISGLIGIILFIVTDFAGLAGNQALQWVGVPILAAIVFLAHKEFVRDGDGFMSYGQGLGIGTLLSLVSSVLSSVFTFIYTSYVNPAFIEAIREKAEMDMEEQGMSDAQIEQAMQFTESFTSPMALMIFGIIGGVFFGFLISLIVAAITKVSRPEFE